MYLKAIEMQGFKSFPDKTVLDFGKGITAVVGPNGSGKSNLSDAMRWVLGEQSTKNLRGSKMEDVIFSGTDSRRAVGFAEVTLKLDNSDMALNNPEKTVTVTRRYYRSGESEYRINGEYNIPDEFIQEKTYVQPEIITLTGPETDLALIEKAFVEVEFSGDYHESFSQEGDIILLDGNGSVVSYNQNVVSLSESTARVYVPIHKRVSLPITFEYTNIPEFFDTANLKYTVSPEEIAVEGEDYLLDKFSDIFVGYITFMGPNYRWFSTLRLIQTCKNNCHIIYNAIIINIIFRKVHSVF